MGEWRQAEFCLNIYRSAAVKDVLNNVAMTVEACEVQRSVTLVIALVGDSGR